MSIGMSRSTGCILLGLVSGFILYGQAFAGADGIKIYSGDLRILGSGNGLVFPDNSVQYKATLQGPQGPQGPQGIQGPPGFCAIPFSGVFNNNAILLQLTNSGAGGALVGANTGTGFAGNFQITNSASPAIALFASTSGTGGAANFEVTSANTTPGVPALRAHTAGNGPAIQGITDGTHQAGNFSINNAGNSSSTIMATTMGTGLAGHFSVDNPNNPVGALFATTNGIGSALQATTSGTGSAAIAFIGNPENTQSALHSWTNGLGSAATFHNDNPQSTASALDVWSSGLGPAASFHVENPENTGNVLVASTSGSGQALNAFTTGTGNAAFFSNSNPGNTAPTLVSSNTGGAGPAMLGIASGSGSAVAGSTSGSGNAAAFSINNPSSSAPALEVTTNGLGPAAAFHGRVTANGGLDVHGDVFVNGNLAKSSGSFKIDHPLDPRGKFLYHSFVESPDMKNIYDGLAVLDAAGAATVELPEWFEKLNGDYRYQLTAIGKPAPGLHVSREVSGGSFVIAGGSPGLKVSWQVTGIRRDAYARKHRVPVEVDKTGAELGTCVTPEACE